MRDTAIKERNDKTFKTPFRLPMLFQVCLCLCSWQAPLIITILTIEMPSRLFLADIPPITGLFRSIGLTDREDRYVSSPD